MSVTAEMAPPAIRDKDTVSKIKAVGSADIVVGIPSFNNARTIAGVVRAVNAGLAKYFADMRSVLVNSDGSSTDGTPDIVLDTKLEDVHAILLRHELPPIHKIVIPYHGIPGKGSALRSILEIGTSLGARAIAFVDSDLRSITPEWVDLLVSPVVREGFDYVTPLYARHKYDGTITNSIVYPLTRALYGKRIRQPIGGEFGLSGPLASVLLSDDVWDTDVARYGIDIWMTTTALTRGFRVCESFLGAKLHDQKDPSVDLSSMLKQVVGCVFDLMERYEPVWRDVQTSTGVPLFGLKYDVGLEPVYVNIDRMISHFKQGVESLSAFWKPLIAEDNIRGLESISKAQTFEFPDELWVRVIYDFAVAHHQKKVSSEHLLKSLTPLYVGKVASLFLAMRESDYREAEEIIEKLCTRFETLKVYLIERWHS